jgi:hypothetical protein
MNVITRKWTPWVAGFDPHGQYIDSATEAAFFEFIDRWKPEIRINGGDNWDFKQLRKGASAEEKKELLTADVMAGKAFNERFVPTHLVRGNHDERLWDLAKYGQGVEGSYAVAIVNDLEDSLRSMGTQVFPYDKRRGVMQLGSLKVFHGFRTGVSAARMSGKTYGSCMFGHVHQYQCATIEGLEQRTAYSIPCLAQVDYDYNRAQEGSLTHENGWSYGVVDLNSGAFQVWVARKFDGLWLLPTGLEEF